MGCVQSYFKRAHNAGISPSSTQESNSKQPVSEDGGARAVQEERSITEEPESNDTSYGVEATAVRTLAASTGTVAILGTTAKTGEKKGEDGEDGRSSSSATPAVVETIPEEQDEASVEKAEVAEEVKVEEGKGEVEVEKVKEEKEEESSSKPESRTSSRPNVEEISEKNETKVEIEKEPPSSTSVEVKEDSLSTSPAETNKSPVSDSNNSERVSPSAKSPVVINEELESKKDTENSLELAKDKEEDVSKSISSERLKTNSISNTTLSSDSIVEFDNNSVKQSPSTDKVIESFDSSSTVEFVDTAAKESLKQEGNKTNPARSISSDLSIKANLPLDGEKTPDVLSPEEKEGTIDEELPPPPPPLGEEESVETASADVNAHSSKSAEEKISDVDDKESIKSQTSTENPSKDKVLNDDVSLDSEISSNLTSSVQTVVQNESLDQEVPSKDTIDNNSSNTSEENIKAESGSPFSSDNNSSINDNGESAPSPVTAVSMTPATSGLESAKESIDESGLSQNHSERVESEVVKTSPEISEKQNVETVAENNKEDLGSSKAESKADSIESNSKLVNGLSSRSETPNDHKPEIAIKEDISQSKNVESNSIEKVEKVINELTEPALNGKVSEDVIDSLPDLTDEKVLAAATTIQASFRGFQTRQNLKSSDKEAEHTGKLEVESNENDSKEVKTAEGKAVEANSNAESIESILENVDEKLIDAATKIQASFRGFQTRQTLKSNVDSGVAPSLASETTQSAERTPTALTPELIESVKEEVDEICKEAEAIVAERSESVEGMLRGVQNVVVGTKESALPSVSDSILAVRGSATPPSVDTDEAKEEVFDSLTDVDEKTISAATTIQATFRGYQARKTLQDDSEQPDSMPDYPPPDEYLQSLEDLPPPDFEALESSYSEDVPTEPLVPPPPPDSEIFNEEDEDELELASLQRPQECDELPEHRLTQDTESEPSDSSLSSAATKIQAGVRGYLTRKQIQTQGGTGTGTTSTSTNRTAADSDGSLSVDGMRSAISTEEESEVTRHRATPDSEGATGATGVPEPRPSRSATKRMSLAEPPSRSHAPMRSRALSVQVAGAGPAVSDEEVWNTLKSEMADAATKIQSNFRGYRARKQLQREDAVQGTSSSSQATPTPSGSVEAPPQPAEQRASGEYHDIIALSPPAAHPRGEGQAAEGEGEAVADQPADAMVKRRASGEDAAAAATKIQATFRGFKTRQEMKDVDRAAAKIQAGFRGYKVRKEMKQGGVRRASNPEGVDPQTEKAATKIQAGVRGFLVRRRVQRGKSEGTTTPAASSPQ